MKSQTLTNGTIITEEIMSVAEFRASLTLETTAIQEKLVGLKDTDKVNVIKQHAGMFGTFFVDVKAVA